MTLGSRSKHLGTTWTPRGQRPILRRVERERRGLSTAVGLTLAGKIYKRHFERIGLTVHSDRATASVKSLGCLSNKADARWKPVPAFSSPNDNYTIVLQFEPVNIGQMPLPVTTLESATCYAE